MRYLLMFFIGSALSLSAEMYHTLGNFSACDDCELVSQVSGRVSKVFVSTGDRVKKGDPLVEIDPTLFSMDQRQQHLALEVAALQLREAQKNYDRMHTLYAAGDTPAISEKTFEEAALRLEQARLAHAQQQVALERANHMLKETVIYTPIDGIVTELSASVGKMIRADKVAKVEKVSGLTLKFHVPQSVPVEVGALVKFEWEGKERFVKVSKMDHFLDKETRTRKCKAYVENENLEIPAGSFAKVTLES